VNQLAIRGQLFPGLPAHRGMLKLPPSASRCLGAAPNQPPACPLQRCGALHDADLIKMALLVCGLPPSRSCLFPIRRILLFSSSPSPGFVTVRVPKGAPSLLRSSACQWRQVLLVSKRTALCDKMHNQSSLIHAAKDASWLTATDDFPGVWVSHDQPVGSQ
jgi:hypothetical protein